NRAVSLLAEAKQGREGGSSALKELGDHPEDGKPVRVMKGRFGPYVKHNKINATIPKDHDPESLTMEEAVAMLAAKAAKPARGKKTPAKKATAKKKAPAKKKTSAKT
ncbi:MAG: DNA topoisomerase I, partial [Proteobacteria bacterium]|nr:DNA topoisomerase I [Pseudomonadota bacterium]